jgi:hypothetical protein
LSFRFFGTGCKQAAADLTAALVKRTMGRLIIKKVSTRYHSYLSITLKVARNMALVKNDIVGKMKEREEEQCK